MTIVLLIMIRDHYESCCVCLSGMVFGNHYSSCYPNCGRCQFSIKEADITAVWIVLFLVSGAFTVFTDLSFSVFLCYALFYFLLNLLPISLVSNN